MNRVALDPSCYIEGCPHERLAYGHACADHDPLYVPPAPVRCQRPLRCYCPAPTCYGHPDHKPTWANPGPPPQEVRDQLAELRARRAEKRTA